MTNTQPKKNKNKDWKEKFIKKHEILAVSDEFAIKVYNFAFPKNLIDFISQLLSELSSDFEECVGEDETEEDAEASFALHD